MLNLYVKKPIISMIWTLKRLHKRKPFKKGTVEKDFIYVKSSHSGVKCRQSKKLF